MYTLPTVLDIIAGVNNSNNKIEAAYRARKWLLHERRYFENGTPCERSITRSNYDFVTGLCVGLESGS